MKKFLFLLFCFSMFISSWADRRDAVYRFDFPATQVILDPERNWGGIDTRPYNLPQTTLEVEFKNNEIVKVLVNGSTNYTEISRGYYYLLFVAGDFLIGFTVTGNHQAKNMLAMSVGHEYTNNEGVGYIDFGGTEGNFVVNYEDGAYVNSFEPSRGYYSKPLNYSYSYTVNVEDCDSCEGTSCSSAEFGSTSGKINNNSSYPFLQGGASQTLGNGSGVFNLSFPAKRYSNSNLTDPNLFLYQSYDSTNEEKLNNSDGHLRQVKNDEGLTWIKVIDENTYEVIQCKIEKVGPKDAEGFYTITGTPDTKLTFSKEVATPHILNIKEEKGGNTVSHVSFDYNDTDKYWKLGRDNDGDGTFESYEYTSEVEEGDNLIKTYNIYDGSNQLVSKIKRTYDAKYNLVEEIIDPDTKAQTTSYTYDDSNNLTRVDYPDGTWEETTYTSNNEPELITRSSGRFINYEYDTSDRIIKKIESFNGSEYSENDNIHKVTTYNYTPVVTGDTGSVEVEEPRTVSVSLLGNPVSVTYYGYLAVETITIQGATPTAGVNDVNNLISRTFTNAEGEVVKEINPDGTGTIIERVTDGTSLTVTTDNGVLSVDTNSIISGTSTVEIFESDLEVSTTVSDIASGFLISSRTVTARDGQDRENEVQYHDGTYETFIYNCCNLDTVTSRDGIETSYTYDGLDREESSTINGVTRIYTYDPQGNQTGVYEQAEDGTKRTISLSHYGLTGELEWAEDGEGNRTTYSKTYVDGETTELTTYPNLKTRETVTDSEGRILSVRGSGTFHETADLDNEFVITDSELGYAVHVQQYGKEDNWTKVYTDAIGRAYKTETSTGAVSKEYFDSVGNLVKSVAANGATTLYYNDLTQNISIQALDVNQNGLIDYGVDSTDVITRSQSDYILAACRAYQ